MKYIIYVPNNEVYVLILKLEVKYYNIHFSKYTKQIRL